MTSSDTGVPWRSESIGEGAGHHWHFISTVHDYNKLFTCLTDLLPLYAGRQARFKLVNYSVYYPVLQYCAHKTSKNLALILHRKLANLALFLQDLARVRKVDVNVRFLARN